MKLHMVEIVKTSENILFFCFFFIFIKLIGVTVFQNHLCLIIKTRFSHLELKILDVGFQNLVVTNEARPKSRSFEWTVSLGDMTVKNLYDKAHSFPSLLSPSQVKVKTRQVLVFELAFL